MMKLFEALTCIILSSCAINIYADTTQSNLNPQGDNKQLTTTALETGAKMLQDIKPLKKFNVYLIGFHPMKSNPSHQMAAHHFCRQVNEDFMQCILFDGNSNQSNLTGIEYIISEKLFNKLPAKEKQYWHPHNYEILSGELIAPGIPDVAEKQLMKKKMNSYGKTWHLWMTDNPENTLPLGEPELAWSFNHDGEIKPELIKDLEKKMEVNLNAKRLQRQDLTKFANPQSGVNAIANEFPGPIHSIPGVVDVSDKQ